MLWALVAAPEIFSQGVQTHYLFIFTYLAESDLRWHLASLVVACGLGFPDQGLNLGPLHRELRVLATGPPGKSLFSLLHRGNGVSRVLSHSFMVTQLFNGRLAI